MSAPDRPFEDIGKRLALVRRAVGLNGSEIADKLQIGPTRWSNWETGLNQIPPQECRKLKRMLPGLSSDWIYDGDRDRLSYELATLFDKLASEPEAQPNAPKRRGRPSRH